MQAIVLNIVVVVSGALVMLLELLGSRIFAPFLGTTLYVWTSVIGVVMAGLALGYYAGGKLSDIRPDRRLLAIIFFGAAVTVIFLSYTKDFLLVHFEFSEMTLLSKSFFASLIIFGPMNIFFGMVVPFAVKLSYQDEGSIGSTSGRIYALSTCGSILGTFLAGFYLIPTFGLQELLVGASVLLILLALFVGWPSFSRKEKIIASLVCAIVIALSFGSLTFSYSVPGSTTVADINTLYSRILVRDVSERDTGRPIRLFANNQSAIYLDSTGPNRGYFDYINFLRLFEYFKPDFKNILVLGGAAYTFPQYVSAVYPERQLTVVEIDPEQVEVAKKYFGFTPSPNFKNIGLDGRSFFNTNKKYFDVIVLDAYGGGNAPPFEIATQEFFRKVSNSLSPDGVLVSNIISAVEGRDAQFFEAELTTVRSVFPEVRVFPVSRKEKKTEMQNIVLVASKKPLHVEPPSLDEGHAYELSHEISLAEVKKSFILTDMYAPVEHMVLGFKPFIDF